MLAPARLAVDALLPALALMAQRPGRHHMLPFQLLCASQLFARLVATGLQVDALVLVGAAAIEVALQVLVDAWQHFLGVSEIAVSDGVRTGDQLGLGGQRQAEQRSQYNSIFHGAAL